MGVTVWNTLKGGGGGTEKRGGETKILKRGWAGQGVGALKRAGGWNPLTNYDIKVFKSRVQQVPYKVQFHVGLKRDLVFKDKRIWRSDLNKNCKYYIAELENWVDGYICKGIQEHR